MIAGRLKAHRFMKRLLLFRSIKTRDDHLSAVIVDTSLSTSCATLSNLDEHRSTT